eukprot:CAMPEP_0181460028 /NCGR_PEP_ID=MMETSP1110-20121109/33129_1 /TAXON_ID=174948 /ORGANISM="Symbiodinium sp., Strain CCMP421" /LENGTH=943 /DNA_ID=CAMNT_0023584565 /DNA_START=32 /DNA_END=2860 /DNA_ORIENTATION=+
MASEEVLRAFQRFDKDGSGSISRDELGEVLQTLDKTWEDASIDRLLSEADESGDGELQVAEFIRWVFAEDSSLFEMKDACQPGEYTISISGCPLQGLNGQYVQQKQYYGRRPVFVKPGNAYTRKFLYYNKPGQMWMIGKSTSKTMKVGMAMLQTTRAVHLAGPNATWAVNVPIVRHKQKTQQSLKKAPKMTAVLPSAKSHEQLIAETPAFLGVLSRWDIVSGGFKKKQAGLHNHRPVYYNEEKGTWIFHNQVKKRWELGREVSDSATPLGQGVESKCYSPDQCCWEQGVSLWAANPDAPPMSVTVEDGFFDEEFPHSQQSIQEDKFPCEWISARDPILCDSPVLFDGIAPSDVYQGGIGDCWLIAAISCVCEFPGYVRDHLFQTKELSNDGKYEIWLYHWPTKEWRLVVIDDFIPCIPRKNGWELHANPRFAKIKSDKMYVCLLEKAFAKFSGSYNALRGGHGVAAWVAMTGETDIIGLFREKRFPEWEVMSDTLLVRAEKDGSSEHLGELKKGAKLEEIRRDGQQVQYKKLEGEGPDEGWVSVRLRGRKVAKCIDPVEFKYRDLSLPEKIVWGFGWSFCLDSVNQDGLWEKLVEYDQKNYLFGCHWFLSEKEKEYQEEYGIVDGLIPGHAYSMLHAREVFGERLICIRNPHGNGAEWKGPWSDQSEEWEANPEIAEALDYANLGDGKFWMDLDDFCRTWDAITVCRKEMPVTRDSFKTETTQASQDDEECYVVVAAGEVKGVFTDLDEAKQALNEIPHESKQYRMICAAQYGKVQDDPHSVAGQNQGAGMAEGFNKCWWGWPQIREMNKIAQEYLLNHQASPKAESDSEECYVVVAAGEVKGVFTDLDEAKQALNEIPHESKQYRMICAAQYGKVQDDPHSVAGQNQGAGMAEGFNKCWWGWPQIREMNKIAQEYLLNHQASPKAESDSEECYVVVAAGEVK